MTTLIIIGILYAILGLLLNGVYKLMGMIKTQSFFDTLGFILLWPIVAIIILFVDIFTKKKE